MKKILLLFILLLLTTQAIQSQTVVLDSNGVTLKWTGTTVPSPYFVQANPRGTGMEWFAIVDNSTRNNITNYAKNIQSGITFFTRPSTSAPIPFNNIVTTLVTNMSSLFENINNFNQAISSWDLSNATVTNKMFKNIGGEFNLPIGSWNVSNVSNMSEMFYGASGFNQPIGSWNVGKVILMNSMFYNASSFNQNINSWNVSNVINMAQMFNNDVTFNQPIGSWNVSNVTDMNGMFVNASRFNQPIGSWDVSKVTNMSFMFGNTSAFNQPIGSWNVSKVTTMSDMFTNSGLSTANYDDLLIGWSTITATETPLQNYVTFSAGTTKCCNGASARKKILASRWTITDGGVVPDCGIVLDSNGVTLKYIGTIIPSSGPYPYLIQADPRGTGKEWFAIVNNYQKAIITSYAKNISLGRSRFTPPGSTTPIPFNNIVTTLMTDMSSMFNDATTFNQTIASWDVSEVVYMSDMFLNATAFNQPIGHWDVSKVNNMSAMFSLASSFNQPIGSWNVSQVRNMSAMFYNATAFNQPIDSWDVSKVIYMSDMFSLASSFDRPIGSWNMSQAGFMDKMFNNSGLSTANYDATLIGWSTITAAETLQLNVTFSAGTTKYCNGASARGSIISTYRWTITDGGFDCSVSSPKVVLDTNNVTLKYLEATVPSPYLIQANPRGTGMEWFAIVDNNTKSKITDYAKGIQSGITYFTPTGSTTPIPFNNIVTTLVTDMSFMFTYSTSTNLNSTTLLFNQNISSWDVSSVTNMDNMFSNSIEFNQPIGSWDVSKVTNMKGIFYNATAFNQPIGSWDVSKVTNMLSMFNRAVAFKQPIGDWNVSNVTDMGYMFRGATSNQLIDSWNVSNVTNMYAMFLDCTAFDQNIGAWNVGNVTDMRYMFYGATAFNQNIGAWNVNNVTNMYAMFSGATAFNQNIGSWNVGNVTDMRYMFSGATAFNQNIGAWNVSNVTNMFVMFYGATAFNQNIGAWNVSNVTNMASMFFGAGLSTANYDATLIGWSTITSTETALKPNVNFNAGTSKYCNGASGRNILTSAPNNWTITDAGLDCSSLPQVVLDSNNVTLKYSGTALPTPYFIQANPRGTGTEWFAIVDNNTKSQITDYAKGIQSGITYFTPTGSTTPIPFNNIVTTLVTDMSFMFENASAFNQPIGSWDVSKVTDMDWMFLGATAFNQPIDSWNVSNVTIMKAMFYNHTTFNQNIGSWDVSKVTDMSYMFVSAFAFNQNISSWNVSKVTNMSDMFKGAIAFNQPINSWNVSSVTNMSYMFKSAPAFNQPIDSWNVSNVTTMSYMFNGATAFNQPIGSWNVSNVTDMGSMFVNAKLSTANYDATLIGWATRGTNGGTLKTNVSFSGGNSNYCNSASARSILTSAPNNWTITDAGLNCSSLIVLDTNGVTIKYTGTTVPSPYFVQANPRGTGMEWFAIVNNSTKNNITNYAKVFQSGRTYFTPPGSSTPIPFSNIVTTLVTDMSLMFNNAIVFNQNIGSWDVSNVTNMEDMISDAPAFNQPIGSWDVSKVTTMSRMFVGASTFNQNIKSWNVSKVTNMSYMFYYAKAFNQPIDSWNVSNVTDMSGMFDVASSFNQPIGSWNVSKVTDMSDMFNNSGLSTANYDATLIGWSTITATEIALQPNVTFSAGTSKYCNGASARNILTSAPNNWTITDSGLDCTSLGTKEFEAISYKLYPNPVVSVLNVKIDSKLINQTYFILDTLGRSVLNGQLNEVDTAINVAQLSKGIYYIKVADNNSSKFIKL